MSEGAAPKGSGASCYVRGFQHPARTGAAPNLAGLRAMSNIYYLDGFRTPEGALTASRARLKKSLDEAWAARDAMLASRAARELTQPIPENVANTLQTATPIVVYFISSGRNAWHSTWMQKYEKNTLMSSYDASRTFIGSRMTQGTAFRMTITPAWHLRFSSKSFLVCEINTSRPFSRLLEAAFTVPGISEEQAVLLLKPTSPLWQGPAPRHDSIIVQQTNRSAREFAQWGESDDEWESVDWIRTLHANRSVDGGSTSKSPPEKSYIYDPRKPWNYGRYVRDTSKETQADFFFTPARRGGPAEFDCKRFRVLAAAAQVVATP